MHRPTTLILAGAAAVFAAFAAGTSPARAERVEHMGAVGATLSGSIASADDVVTLAFLVGEGNGKKLVLTAKAAKKSPLQPDVKIFDPDGELFDPLAAGGSLKTKPGSWSAKIPNVERGGLWRVEVRGGAGTTGDFTFTIGGKDQTTAAAATVVPSGAFTDVPIFVGQDQALTVVVRRGRGATLLPQLRILDPNGEYLGDGATFGTVNAKTGQLTLKAFRLPSFGRYTIRIQGEGLRGGPITYSAKSVPAKIKGTVPVAVAGASFEVDPGSTGMLDASGTAGSNLGYRWVQVGGPTVELSDATAMRPTFVAPNGAAALAFELSVDESGILGRSSAVAVEVARRPVADAGRSQSVAASAAVTLDGTGSVDRRPAAAATPPLRFRWRQNPAGAQQVTLAGADTAAPTFAAPAAPGVLRFLLEVDDGTARSLEDEVVVAVGAGATVADAGRPQVVTRMATVNLSALGSRTASGLLDAGFEWTQIGGTPVALDNPQSAYPAFTATRTTGDLLFRLTVDGAASSADDVRVRVLANETNTVPATRGNGVRFVGPAGGTASLDASGTTDANQADVLRFRWGQVAGTLLALGDAAAATTSVVAPAGNATRSYAVLANDGLAYGPVDLVHVRTTGYSGQPVANAGADVTTTPGVSILLDGRGSSRTQGTGPITYRWRQVTATDWFDVDGQVGGFNPEIVTPSFVFPSDVSSLTSRRTITFELVVNDGVQDSDPDLITLTLNQLPTNGAPQVTAGASTLSPIAGGTVTLQATVFDREDDPVTVRWTQVAGPSDVSSLTSRRTITFELIVNDGVQDSDPDLMTLTLNQLPTNGAPQVTAGASTLSPIAGAPVTLQATVFDREDDPVTVRWSQVAGPSVTLSSTTSLTPSFVAPKSGVMTFRVIGNDGFDDSPPSNVSIVVDSAPTARPSSNPAFGLPGTLVTIDGSGSSDPEGGVLTYQWTQLSSFGSIPASSTAQSFQFTAPSGTALYQLVVNDGRQRSAPATISFAGAAPVLIDAPTANSAGTGSAEALYGETVTLAVTVTQGGPTRTYSWRQVNTSGLDPVVSLSSSTAASPTFSGPVPSATPFGTAPTVTLGVTVSDGTTTSTERTVTVKLFASFNNSTKTSETVYTGIIAGSCTSSSCHSGTADVACGSGQAYGMGSASAFRSNSISKQGCLPSKTRISSGSSSSSGLWDRISTNAKGQPQMPTTGSLTAKQQNIIKDWIDQGAKDN